MLYNCGQGNCLSEAIDFCLSLFQKKEEKKNLYIHEIHSVTESDLQVNN